MPDRDERERMLKTCSTLEAYYRGVANHAAADARKNPHPDRRMKLGALRDYASTLGLQLDKEATKAARLIDGYMSDVVERDDGVADGDALYDPILDDLEEAAPMMMQAMAKLCGAVRPNAKYGAFPDRTKPSTMRKYRRAIVSFANLRRVRQLRHHFGPFPTLFQARWHPRRAVCCALLGAHAYRMLIGACNPMLCPIHVFRHGPSIADRNEPRRGA